MGEQIGWGKSLKGLTPLGFPILTGIVAFEWLSTVFLRNRIKLEERLTWATDLKTQQQE